MSQDSITRSQAQQTLADVFAEIAQEFGEYICDQVGNKISPSDLEDPSQHKALVLRYLSRWMLEVCYDDCGGQESVERLLENAVLSAAKCMVAGDLALCFGSRPEKIAKSL